MKRQKPRGFGKPHHLLLHPEMAESYDLGKVADLQFFKAHPGVTEFTRPPYPGEAEMVAVTHDISQPEIRSVAVKLLPKFNRVRVFLVEPPMAQTQIVYMLEEA